MKPQIHQPQLHVEVKPFLGDIDGAFLEECRQSGEVACDIETTGLDWRTERVATFQLFTSAGRVGIVRFDDSTPECLLTLLSDLSVRKVFHHAMFDLRFMFHAWGKRANNVACTKIAAKLLDRENADEHTLQALLKSKLGIEIDKSLRTSDWLAKDLTSGQLAYAITDVIYLPQLLQRLETKLAQAHLLHLAADCFAHIPTRVELDVRGYSDIYVY